MGAGVLSVCCLRFGELIKLTFGETQKLKLIFFLLFFTPYTFDLDPPLESILSRINPHLDLFVLWWCPGVPSLPLPDALTFNGSPDVACAPAASPLQWKLLNNGIQTYSAHCVQHHVIRAVVSVTIHLKLRKLHK